MPTGLKRIFQLFILTIATCNLLPTSPVAIGGAATCYSQNADIDLLYSINSGNTASWDKTNKIFSQSMMPVSIGIPISMFGYDLFIHDSVAKRNSYIVSAGLLATGAITTAMKYAINRTRPFVTYPFIIKKSEGGSPSFPSGHTSSAFAAATSLSLAYPKWYVIASSFLWASAVGYSRMELGVHYPSDVLAGAIIGSGSSWLMWKLNRQLIRKK